MEKMTLNKNDVVTGNFFQNIIDSLSAGGIFVDKSRVIKYCNSAAERIFGYSREEILGRKTEVLYGDRRKNPLDKDEIHNRLEDYGYHIGTAKGVKKDGGTMPLSLYTFIIKENSGVAIIIKESDKPSEDIDAMQLLQDLLDHIPDSIYFKDRNNRFIMVNKAIAAGLNVNPGDMLGKNDFDFFPKELAEKYFADDTYIVQTGTPIADKIELTPHPDGYTTYVSTTKIPRFDKNGNIIGTVGITRNVTERMIAEEELRRYKDNLENLVKERTKALEENHEKLLRMYNIKSEFASLVSHELRTPLAVIKESVKIVEDETTGSLNERQKNFLNTTLEHIDRLTRLINDVLDFSKLETKKMRFKRVKGSLNEVIDHVLKSYELVFKKKGLNLNVKLDPFLPLVKFNRDRIAQVLYNLISNAIKFTEKGAIAVETNRTDGDVMVSIEDTGIGIKEKDLYRIFEKFERIDSEDVCRAEGTGLGLAICKQIIETLGGRIWAKSEYGKGSKFFFTLPIK